MGHRRIGARTALLVIEYPYAEAGGPVRDEDPGTYASRPTRPSPAT
ncbi:MAG: hypothetical protein R3C32_00785 [Chloroflexota bacterium]